MLHNLIKFAAPHESKGKRSFRPRVEMLEDRWCPDASAALAALHVTAAAEVLPGHQVRLTGSVTGGDTAGLTVIFTGAVNSTTTTDANGNFSFTTSEASLGLVYATGLGMDTASADIVASRPDVSALSITYVDQDTVSVTGTLTSMDPGGKTIGFSGVGSGSAITDSSGNFSFITDTTGLGMISAVATDEWGQSSDSETAYVADNAPQIVEFECHLAVANTWVFTGRVIDEFPEGMTLRFGGLLEGLTTVVAADGTFTFTYIFASGASGTVTAITTDWWGHDSNLVSDFVG